MIRWTCSLNRGTQGIHADVGVHTSLENFHYLNSLTNITRSSNRSVKKGVGHVACIGGYRNDNRVLV
jgi:hypothetical protein